MAQINFTLNQDEILQLLSDDRNESFKKLLQNSLNSVLLAESSEQLKAAPYERSEDRTDSRNGTRERDLNTRIGTITLTVPRHRNQPFKTLIFDNYSRSEAALIATMTEMVINGVSTRKVSKVVETLCGVSYSKSTVSELCAALDASINEFANRTLPEIYPFVTVDATYFKVRENHKIISKALMIAYATTDTGCREIIGFKVYENESRQTWTDFLEKLQERGLKGVKMFTSDAHDGIIYAIGKVFPDAAWQRCQFHFMRNILDSVPKKYKEGVKQELQEMFQCDTMEEARKKRDEIVGDYRDVAEKAMKCLEEGFESAMTVMAIPKVLRRTFRTSNNIERLNRELKRRSNVIGIFPNEASLYRLMGAVLMERNDDIQSKRKVFYQPIYREFLECEARLKAIAQEQRQLQLA